MDIQKDYSCIERNGRIFSKSINLENDFQEALPAYCDDIYRVVKCLSKSCITSSDIALNEIKLFGKTTVHLTYYNENSDLCYADFEEEISKTVSLENLSESAFAFVRISEKYTNFRVINQRRIDVHSSSSISLDVYDKNKCPCISSCADSKLKYDVIKCSDIIGTNISKIEFDEEFPLPSELKPVKRIISSCANSTINETKIIKDKALIKGLVNVSMLYTADSTDELQKAEYSVEFSKIIDVAGINDNDIIICDSSVSNLYLKAKAVSDDKLNIIDVFGEVSVNSVFIRENEKKIVTDGYVLNRTSECSYSELSCMSEGKNLKECRLFNVSVDLPSDVAEIKEICVTLSNPVIINSKLITSANINILNKTTSGDYTSFSSNKELELPVEGYNSAVSSITVQSVDYSLSGAKIDIRINTEINAYLFNESSIKVLSDINPQDGYIEYPSLTVYFGKENESVWSIAKSFSSDIDLIIKENELTSEVLEANKVLIIPKV